MKNIPVYLFTGFLESGKTKFIKETLKDKNFNDGKKKFLLLLCEEGEEEFSQEDLGSNISVFTFEDEDALTTDRITAQCKRNKPDIMLIEYNGMWKIDSLYRALPEFASVFQEIFISDSETVMQYNRNMRSLVVDKLTSCEMVVFNRVKSDTDREALHKLVRGVSRSANICYEDPDGNIEFDDIEDPLPYDINADVIEIRDEDFAIFYRDMSEDLGKYNGKRIRFKGIVARDDSLKDETFALGRHVMICCQEDIAYRGVVAKGFCGKKIKTRDWVIAEGVLYVAYDKIYGGEGPCLKVEKLEFADKPVQELATFY